MKIEPDELCCGSVMDCQSDGYDYLVRLLAACAPECKPLPDMIGLCTQIDNLIAGYRIRLGELPDPWKHNITPDDGE